MKVAIVTPAIPDPEHLFGAERLFAGLVAAFQSKVQADWIQVPLSEKRWEGILQGYVDCYDLDLSAYDLVISTKNPTFAVQHPNHVCWLIHQVRVFYDRFDEEFGALPESALIEKRKTREVIHRLDTLSFQRVRKIFSIGHEPACPITALQRIPRRSTLPARIYAKVTTVALKNTFSCPAACTVGSGSISLSGRWSIWRATFLC